MLKHMYIMKHVHKHQELDLKFGHSGFAPKKDREHMKPG